MRTIVVGGGVSGLLCAILARRDGPVTLVERGERLGGLLSSRAGPDGAWFDHGTHVPQETGDPEVDALLFEGMAAVPWRRIDVLRAGSFSFGRLNEDSPFPDLRGLPPTVYNPGVVELLEAVFDPPATAPISALEDLEQRFGATVTQEVFAPVLRMLSGEELDALGPGAHELFLARVIALTPAATRALKSIPALDASLAFHTNAESPSPRAAWYPTEGGCGRWIEDLRATALEGVDLRLGTGIAGVVTRDDRVVRVDLTVGGPVDVDRVIWTLPAVGLLQALQRTIPAGVTPPSFVRTELHHLVLDRPFTTDLHYVTSFDPTIDLFRVTFYPALRGHEGDPPHACTVELMRPPNTAVDEPEAVEVVRRLAQLGVVAPEARLKWADTTSIPVGFPVPTRSFRDDVVTVADAAVAGLDNVALVGRGSGRAFFMADVLRQCHEMFYP